LTTAIETNDLSTAGYISRTLVAILAKSPEVNENELLSTLLHFIDGNPQSDTLLRLLSCVPEVVTSSNLSMHPMRRQALITALTNSQGQFKNLPSLAHAITSPLQSHLNASETTQEAALQVIHSWCTCLGCLPPVGLSENEIKYIHSLAARVGCAVTGGDEGRYLNKERGIAAVAVETIAAMYSSCTCLSEDSEEKHQREREEAVAVLLPMLLNCLPELLKAFSTTITTAAVATSNTSYSLSSLEPLSAAVTILGAATAAAASAPPQSIACEATSEFLTQSLLSLLRHPDSDTRIATLAIFDTWLSNPPSLHQTSSQCYPSVSALTALLQQLIACVNLQGLSEMFLTADARDLPEEAQMMRRETTDSIKLAVTALGAQFAASVVLQLAENAHSRGDTFQLEACLYVANLIPKSALLVENKDHHFIDSLTHLGIVSLVATAPKLAGTALTLLGGLGPVLGDIFNSTTFEPATKAATALPTAFSQALNAIISTLINCETSDPKLSRNAATTIFRLASVPSLVTHFPAAVEALYTWYLTQVSSQALCNQFQHPKFPNDITTSEFVLKSLCLLGGQHAQQSILFEHARRAEEALVNNNDALNLALVTLHLKSIAIVLEIAQSGVKNDASLLGEAGKQLGQLLLHSATLATTTTGVVVAQQGEGIEKLTRSILECSGSLAVVCPDTLDVCMQTLRILAVKDLAGALQALTALTLNIQETSKNGEVGQGIAHVAIEIAEEVFKSCADPSQNQNSDAAFGALLQFLTAFLKQWCSSPSSSFSLVEHVVLATLSAASQSWNRDICEASLALASEVLLKNNKFETTTTTTSTSTSTTTTVLSFLLAACCGGQPPYMLPSISETVYSTWINADTSSFLQVFTSAMALPMQLPGGGAAPWLLWTQETLSKNLTDLFSDSSRKDEKRFKRVFKALCGGKKKGTVGAPPARQ
jgi:hypothetical protein